MALVVFLRGLNVGGRRNFRPTVLARNLEHLGAVNIGAAGTFVIRKRVNRKELRAAIARELPFEAEIVICEGRDIERLAARAPFDHHAPSPDIVRFVSVLSRRPPTSPPLPMTLPATGKWLLKVLEQEERFVLGLYRRDMKVIGYLGKLDDMFGVPATTRNWNTLDKIQKALNAPDN